MNIFIAIPPGETQLKEEIKKCMNARIAKFNVFTSATLRNIEDRNWSNKLVDVINLTTALILMLISKCNANDEERTS